MKLSLDKTKSVKGEKLSDLTWSRYENNIIKLYKVLNPNSKDEEINTDFLKDTQKVKKALHSELWGLKGDKKISPNTIKNYYNSIIITLKITDKEGTKEEVEKYTDLRNELQDDYDKVVNSHEKTDKQEKNWITMKEWNKVLDELKAINKKDELWDKDFSSLKDGEHKRGSTKLERDYLALQNFILMSVYRILPPVRNDYEKMEVISQKDYKAMPDEKKKEHNYLVRKKENNSMYFLLNEYKTKKKYGEKHIDIPPQLAKLIRKWLKVNQSGWLFTDSKGNPLTSNKISKYLTGIFKEHTGKNISSTMLRHIYLSEKHGASLKEMKKDADIMGHSLAQQKDYVKD